MTRMKRCPRCNETMVADHHNFAPRDKLGKLDGWCRPCRAEDQLQRYYKRRQADAAKATGNQPARP